VRSYAVALCALYALGAPWLAGVVVARGGRFAALGFLATYVAVLAAVAVFAVLVVRPPAVTDVSPRSMAIGALLGGAIGALVIGAESLLEHVLRRRARARRPASGGAPAIAAQRTERPAARFAPFSRELTLALLLVVALLEEVLARGVLVQLAVSLPGRGTQALAVAGTVLAFAVAHMTFGWGEALVKLPLGVAATATTLATGSVAAAVAMHAAVNVRGWRGLAARGLR
jgi:membrane protease YdiL (CAAX protease family)